MARSGWSGCWGTLLLWFGRDDNCKMQGVALALDVRLRGSLLVWELVNERLMTAWVFLVSVIILRRKRTAHPMGVLKTAWGRAANGDFILTSWWLQCGDWSREDAEWQGSRTVRVGVVNDNSERMLDCCRGHVSGVVIIKFYGQFHVSLELSVLCFQQVL